MNELLDALRRRGAPDREIQHYRRHALSLAPDTPLPCPLCYVNNRAGALSAIPDDGGFEWVVCGRCGERLGVRRSA